MGQVRVFIYTKSMEYSERFARYAAAKNHPNIQVEQLTEITDQAEFRETDVVVSDDKDSLDKLRCHKIPIVRCREEETSETIFMYQDRETMFRRLLQIIGTSKTGEVPKITCVFSPEGGDAKTQLALWRGVEWSRSRRVLYINLCGFPVFFRQEISRVPQLSRAGVSELFFCTRQDEFEGKLEELSFSMGCMDMIPPVEHYKDLLDFSREEVMRFMSHLKSQKMYDAVVMELGQLFEYSFELLSEASSVLVPEESGFLAEVRWHVFQEYCRREGREEICKKVEIVPVSFPVLQEQGEVERIFQGEGEESGSKRTSSKGKNTGSRFGAGTSRRGI